MSENEPVNAAPEPPQSPAVVKKAADTVAKPKAKPSPAPSPASQPAKSALEKPVEKPVDNSGEKEFNVFSIFGWGD